ncbi:MAG: PPC domain-containing protein [Pirellulales bacterium]
MECKAAIIAACGWLILSAALAAAAPPEAQYFFPAGARRGASVEVTAAGTFADWPVEACVDRPGVTVTALEAKGRLSFSVADDVVPGVCWVRLYNSEGAAAVLPWIVGNLAELDEQEPNDTPRAPQTIELPAVVNGRLRRRGDTDVFAVALQAGQTLVASVQAHRTLASPVDCVLQVASSRGIVLAQNDDCLGLDPQLDFTAPAAATYLVRVFGFPAVPDASIALAGGDALIYRLTLTVGPFVDYTLPLAIAAGQAAPVELGGWNLGDWNLGDGDLGDGPATVTVEASAQGEAAAVFDPRLPQAAWLPVEPHPAILEAEPNPFDQPQPIELPVTVTGRIDPPRDRDVWRFAAVKGQTLLFRIESRGLGYPLDPVLELFDTGDQSLARVDDSGGDRDAELSFAVPADGQYRLVVSDLYEHGGPRYLYRLRAVVGRPDFSLTVAGHAFTLVPGEPLEIPLAIDRQRGFAEEIALEVQGLPAGVSVSEAKSLAGDDSAKAVKLTLTGGAEAFSGPIRIVGRSAGAAPLVRIGEAPLPGRDHRIRDVWLTVRPPRG